MPIIRNTQENDTKARQLPLIAKVRKGAPQQTKTRKDGTEYKVVGKELPYFRFAFNDGYEWLQSHVEALYGAKPSVLPGVMLAAETMQGCYSEWFMEWTGGRKLMRKCDGETIVQRFDPERGAVYEPVPCPGRNNCECRQSGTLYFLLPELQVQAYVYGVFVLETHAWKDLDNFKHTLEEFGAYRLNTLRFRLARYQDEQMTPMEDKKTGKTNRVPTKKWFVRLVPELETLQFALTTTQPQLSPGMAFQVQNPRIAMPQAPALPASISQPAQDVQAPTNGDNGNRRQKKAAPPPAPSNVDWTKGDAAKRIPELRKATGINPPDLFQALNSVGATIEMATETIAARLSGHASKESAPATSEETPPVVTGHAYKARTTPLSVPDFVALANALVKDDLQDKTITSRQTQNLAMLIKEAVPVDNPTKAMFDDMRHRITLLLFGRAGLRELTAGEALALINILTTGDPKTVHPMAYIEIENVLAGTESLSDDVPDEDGDEPIEGEIVEPRTADEVLSFFADVYDDTDSEIADDSRRVNIKSTLRDAIVVHDPKAGLGAADTYALNALGWLRPSEENHIKSMTEAECAAFEAWFASVEDLKTRGQEALNCAVAYMERRHA